MMRDSGGHDWITFHRLRFPEPVSSLERVFPPVAGPDCWLFGPHYDVGPDGMLTGVSDIWGGVGIWHSRDAAEKMVATPGDAMSWLGETAAAWHCLSVPVSIAERSTGAGISRKARPCERPLSIRAGR